MILANFKNFQKKIVQFTSIFYIANYNISYLCILKIEEKLSKINL